MLLILPIVAFVLFFLILRHQGLDRRTSALAAAVFWGASLVAVTEILSVPHRLTRGGVAIAWLTVSVVAFACLEMLKRRARPPSSSEESAAEFLDASTKYLLAGVGLIFLLVGITALVSAPNMWDSMEYHLPRMIMWMNHHSVGFYPTPDYAQLIFGPWAEFAMTHTYLLWGSDRFVNFVEFLAMVGSVIAVSVIARQLGAGLRGQALAAVVAATIPSGVLEASGPMNTFVVSFWIATTVAFLSMWNEDPGWLNTICVGLSAGLAILTKGDAYVYLPPFVLACWWMGSRSSRLLYLKRCGIFLLLILALNAPQFVRNYGLTGSPLGLPFLDGGPRLHWTVDHVSVSETLANTLRNVSVHLAVPGDSVNLMTEKAFRAVIHGMGVDPDDPGTIWQNSVSNYHMVHFSSHETMAGAPIHLFLILLSIGLVVWKRKEGVHREIVWYGLATIGAFVFFCAILRWQPWNSRHHMPVFILGSALVGVVLERYLARKLVTFIGIVLVTMAVLFALVNKTRSLVPWSRVESVYHPRSEQYFADSHAAVAPAFIAAADAVNKLDCNALAIDAYAPGPASELPNSATSFYIYPLFPLIHADGRARTVWYTGVHNLSNRYADQEIHPPPCGVICVDCASAPEKLAEYRNAWDHAATFGYIVIFSGKSTTLNKTARNPRLD